MLLNMDEPGLSVFIRSLYNVTGVRISVYDMNGTKVRAYPHQPGPFCRRVKQNAVGRARCDSCEHQALAELVHSQKPYYIYTCHAGLTGAMAPIVDDGQQLGYIRYSQCISADVPLSAAWESTCKRLSDMMDERDAHALKEPFFGLVRMSSEQLVSCAEVMGACSVYISQQSYVRPGHGPVFGQLNRYISQNLSADLGADQLSEELLLPRNTVYEAVKEETGLSLGQYVRKKRLDYAKMLVLSGRHSMTEIADRCGIHDPSYFARIFREDIGCSPREYQQRHAVGL